MKLANAGIAVATAVIAVIIISTAHAAPIPSKQASSVVRLDRTGTSLLLTSNVIGETASQADHETTEIERLEARAGSGSLHVTGVLSDAVDELPDNGFNPASHLTLNSDVVAPPSKGHRNGSTMDSFESGEASNPKRPKVMHSSTSHGAQPSTSSHSSRPPPSPTYSALLNGDWDQHLFGEVSSLAAHQSTPGRLKSVLPSPDYSAIIRGNWDSHIFDEISSLVGSNVHASSPSQTFAASHPSPVHPAEASEFSAHPQAAGTDPAHVQGRTETSQAPIYRPTSQGHLPPRAPWSGGRPPPSFPTVDELVAMPYLKYRAASKRIHSYRNWNDKTGSRRATDHIDFKEVRRLRAARADKAAVSGAPTPDQHKRQVKNRKRKAELDALDDEDRQKQWRVTNLYKKRKRLGKLSDEEEDQLHSLQEQIGPELSRIRAEMREQQLAEQRLVSHESQTHRQDEPSDVEDGAFHNYLTQIIQTP